jgi:hypothetical protein
MKLGRKKRLKTFGGRKISKKQRKASRRWNAERKPDIDMAERNAKMLRNRL